MVVYILAPANIYTGGPTALFQLCNTLQYKFNIDTYIAFYNMSEEDPVHPNYRKYNCKWIPYHNIDDNPSNYIIAPEVVPYLLKQFKKINKILYFLSVDNYILNTHQTSKLKRRFNFLLFMLKFYPRDLINLLLNNEIKRNMSRFYYNEFCAYYVTKMIRKKNIIVHHADTLLYIAQSKYVAEFLKQQGIEQDKIILIREPLEEEYIKIAENSKLVEHKEDSIAWNARKSYPITSKLVDLLSKKYTIYRLDNVGKEKMIEILSKTKIYIDIGLHPGRDRPPREAVALWNIPIVNIHGGLFYYEDFPTSTKFKVNCYDICKNIDIGHLHEMISQYMKNYHVLIKELDEFRNYIINESRNYMNDVKKFIERIGL